MRHSWIFAFLIALCVSTSASAQTDLRHDLCGVGNTEACFSLEFGRCADESPRVAIPACTRALAQQDNRRTGGNVRFERAIRYTLRALAHDKQGNVDRALSDYDRAVRAHRGVFWIQVQRGDAYFLVGDYEEALESYDAAVELNPDTASVLNNRALIYGAAPDEELHNAPQALADAQRANALAPRQPAYIDCLAVAYAANGDFDRAVAEEQRAINLLPPGDQGLTDDYRGRLNLFQNGMVFRIAPQPET